MSSFFIRNVLRRNGQEDPQPLNVHGVSIVDNQFIFCCDGIDTCVKDAYTAYKTERHNITFIGLLISELEDNVTHYNVSGNINQRIMIFKNINPATLEMLMLISALENSVFSQTDLEDIWSVLRSKKLSSSATPDFQLKLLYTTCTFLCNAHMFLYFDAWKLEHEMPLNYRMYKHTEKISFLRILLFGCHRPTTPKPKGFLYTVLYGTDLLAYIAECLK